MDTEPIGASSAEMDQPTGAVAEIPARPIEIQTIAMVILFVRIEPKEKAEAHSDNDHGSVHLGVRIAFLNKVIDEPSADHDS